MSLTVFLAEFFGILLLIVSLSMAVRRAEMLQVIDGLLRDRALLFLAAILSLSSGILLVLIHDDWTGGLLTIVVTIIGWLLLLRGLFWLFMPAGSLRKVFTTVKKENAYYVVVVVIFLIGLALAYAGLTAAAHGGYGMGMSSGRYDAGAQGYGAGRGGYGTMPTDGSGFGK